MTLDEAITINCRERVEKLEADLAAARAVLDSALPFVTPMPADHEVYVRFNRAAWEAWQARGKP